MKSIGWNEELDLLKSGKLPENIEAKTSLDDAPRKTKLSIFGTPSSVCADVARDNSAYEKRRCEAKKRETGEQVFGQNASVEIPHNQNRAPVSEIQESYVWQIPLVLVVLFIAGIYILIH